MTEAQQIVQALFELDPPCPFPPSDGRYKAWFSLWERVAAEARVVAKTSKGPCCEQCGETFSPYHDCPAGDHHYTAQGVNHPDAPEYPPTHYRP